MLNSTFLYFWPKLTELRVFKYLDCSSVQLKNKYYDLGDVFASPPQKANL